MLTLAEFLLRLCFGLPAAMAFTSPRRVTSGYYRNNLYVTLGLGTLAALLTSTASGVAGSWPAWTVAATSYAGSVCWLYEKPQMGRPMLLITSAAALWGAWQLSVSPSLATTAPATTAAATGAEQWQAALALLQIVASGLLLGTATAAMLLGHWYLNSPGMQLAPLWRLIVFLGAAALLQAAICGSGLALEMASGQSPMDLPRAMFVVLRWAFGLAGVIALAWMARETLKVPNTQSATGILYVAVIGAFVGETTSLLLTSQSVYPL